MWLEDVIHLLTQSIRSPVPPSIQVISVTSPVHQKGNKNRQRLFCMPIYLETPAQEHRHPSCRICTLTDEQAQILLTLQAYQPLSGEGWDKEFIVVLAAVQ